MLADQSAFGLMPDFFNKIGHQPPRYLTVIAAEILPKSPRLRAADRHFEA